MSTHTLNSIRPRRTSKLRTLAQGRHSREIGLALLIVALIVTFGVKYPDDFPTWENARAVLRGLASDGVLAVGMMLLLIGGMFDLSVGSIYTLAGVVAACLMTDPQFEWSALAALTAGMAVASLAGLFNGIVIAIVKVNPLITTLGTMGIYRGLAILLGGTGKPYSEEFRQWGRTDEWRLEWIGEPVAPYVREIFKVENWGLILLIVVALLFHYFLAHTRFFRQFYYIGSNAKAAVLSGIAVTRLQIFAFTLMGFLAGLAGIAFTARLQNSSATAGDGAELRAITAVVLGGASLAGGRGTIVGALLGVLFIALIKSVMFFAHVNSNWQSIIIGGVLVTAVGLDSLLNRRSQ
jgi:ribose/xylose/arabinose/galactoside ABC-type transport system permease subunit